MFAAGVDIFKMQSNSLGVDILPPLVQTPVKTPTSSRKFEAPLDLSSIPELLRKEATKAGLAPSEPWIGKVEQLFMMTQLKHGGNCSRTLHVSRAFSNKLVYINRPSTLVTLHVCVCSRLYSCCDGWPAC